MNYTQALTNDQVARYAPSAFAAKHPPMGYSDADAVGVVGNIADEI